MFPIGVQPVAAVRQARAVLGPDLQLHVVVRCALEADPQKAHDLARRACAFYMVALKHAIHVLTPGESG